MQTFSTLICREAADHIDDNILVYPNPARNLIYISIPQTGDYQYQIVILGKLFSQEPLIIYLKAARQK